MIDKLRNKKQYNPIMLLIENYIQKATKGGGFHALSSEEATELDRLSRLAENYEDQILKIMHRPRSL